MRRFFRYLTVRSWFFGMGLFVGPLVFSAEDDVRVYSDQSNLRGIADICLCKDSTLKNAAPAPTVFLHFVTNEVWNDPKALQLLKIHDDDRIKTFILDVSLSLIF